MCDVDVSRCPVVGGEEEITEWSLDGCGTDERVVREVGEYDELEGPGVFGAGVVEGGDGEVNSCVAALDASERSSDVAEGDRMCDDVREVSGQEGRFDVVGKFCSCVENNVDV